MEKLPKKPHSIIRSCDFLVDYEPDAIAQAIRSVRFHEKDLKLDLEEIPVLSHVRAWRRVFGVCLYNQTYGYEVPEALSKVPCANRPLVLADPLTSILFIALNAKMMRRHYFVSIFTDTHGQQWVINMEALVREPIIQIHPTCPEAIYRDAAIHLATPSRPLAWAS
ncbi:MAG: hypothetical protein WC735_03365 [Candidatus Paceibacterota bacterium]|jgi:hypothetical protein